MLKRYQVMLEDWQQEYVENLAETYDLAISEVIRLEVCAAIISSVSALYPDYKPGFDMGEIVKEAVSYGESASSEDFHKLVSKIYFEARKAAEYRKKQRAKS